ncbi:MAG: endonuclease, partial [Turneriella sp.]|nr:endonuclease [Turneriella sp.]
AAGGNEKFPDFAAAKKVLRRFYLREFPFTFYCNCRISGKDIDFASCGYTPRRDNARAHRIEWEHVVPAENFGRSFPEWREGHPDCVRFNGKPYKGRLCARRTSELFNRMEADLYNLVPEIGELNAERSNYRYGIIPGEERAYGQCDFEVAGRVAEPRPEIRGDIARIYFYMDDAYPKRGIVGDKSRRLFEAWNVEDPVDAVECHRAYWIEKLQGNPNRFVKEPCQAKGLYK